MSLFPTLGKSFLAFATASLAVGALAPVAGAHTPGRGVTPGSRLFVPVPSKGRLQQEVQLLGRGDVADARLLANMELQPQAVWFTGGTPAQVQELVRVDDAGSACRARRTRPGRVRHTRARLCSVLRRRSAGRG